MDDLEDRLATDLHRAADAVRAGQGLAPAVRRAVRHRRIRTAIGVAVPLVVLLLGAAWLVDRQTDDASELDTIVEPDVPEPEPSDPPVDPLRTALEDLGAAVDTAPDGVAELGDAHWCGSTVQGRNLERNAVAGCLFEAIEGDLGEAVMVRSVPTIEGDPVIEVIRAPATAQWEGTVWTDSSQDRFGLPGWSGMRCDLTFAVEGLGSPGSDATVSYSECRVLDEELPTEDVEAIALAAPGSTTIDTDREWPFGRDRMEAYLVPWPFEPDLPYRWAFAGYARPSGAGTAVDVDLPLRLAELGGTEFAIVDFVPLIAGTYAVLLGPDLDGGMDEGDPLAIIEVTRVDDAAEPEPPDPPEVDPARAALRAGGIGPVDFGVTADDAIARLEPLLGPVLNRESSEVCATSGYATFESGVVIEFRSGGEGGSEEFVAWYYGGIHPFTGNVLPGGDLTTTDGIGLGTTAAQVRSVGGGFSGGYDAFAGARHWLSGEEVAGLLTVDATDPSSTVASITGGRGRAPARTVC